MCHCGLCSPVGTHNYCHCLAILSSMDHCAGLDWIEQGLTFPPTQYRLSGRQFYRSKDPTNSIKVLKE